MTSEPESLILQLLRDTRADIADMRGEMATKSDLAALRAETKTDISELRDQISDVVIGQARTNEQIVGLRRAVMEYHTSVIGHGVLISDLEARVRRLEQRMDGERAEAH